MVNIFKKININSLRSASQSLIKGKVTFSRGNPAKGVDLYLSKFDVTVSQIIRITALSIQRDAKLILNTKRPDRPAPTTNTGALRDSLKVDIREAGAKTTASVYVGKEYGVWVEFGRRGIKSSPKGSGMFGFRSEFMGRAAFPPFYAILQWVIQRKIRGKGGLGRDKKTGGESQNKIAKAIRKHIGLYGVDPQPYLMPAYRRHIKGFKERLANAVRNIKI